MSFYDMMAKIERLETENERLRRLLEPFAGVAELAAGGAVFITYASGVRIETRPSIWSAIREWEDAADIAAIEAVEGLGPDCKRCDGSGQIPDPEDGAYDSALVGCPDCEGTGEATAEKDEPSIPLEQVRRELGLNDEDT